LSPSRMRRYTGLGVVESRVTVYCGGRQTGSRTMMTRPSDHSVEVARPAEFAPALPCCDGCRSPTPASTSRRANLRSAAGPA
jgi:hypothetical protein